MQRVIHIICIINVYYNIWWYNYISAHFYQCISWTSLLLWHTPACPLPTYKTAVEEHVMRHPWSSQDGVFSAWHRHQWLQIVSTRRAEAKAFNSKGTPLSLGSLSVNRKLLPQSDQTRSWGRTWLLAIRNVDQTHLTNSYSWCLMLAAYYSGNPLWLVALQSWILFWNSVHYWSA